MSYNASIFSLGNSHAVRLPKKLLEAIGFLGNEKVVISTNEDDAIIIKKAARRTYSKSLEDRFAGYTGGYSPVEWDVGGSVGKEIF